MENKPIPPHQEKDTYLVDPVVLRGNHRAHFGTLRPEVH